MGQQINIQTTGQSWDNDICPLVVTYWTAVAEIQRRAAVKGLTNAAVQTLATACLGMLNGQIPAVGNTLNIVCAAGLAANNWS